MSAVNKLAAMWEQQIQKSCSEAKQQPKFHLKPEFYAKKTHVDKPFERPEKMLIRLQEQKKKAQCFNPQPGSKPEVKKIDVPPQEAEKKQSPSKFQSISTGILKPSEIKSKQKEASQPKEESVMKPSWIKLDRAQEVPRQEIKESSNNLPKPDSKGANEEEDPDKHIKSFDLLKRQWQSINQQNSSPRAIVSNQKQMPLFPPASPKAQQKKVDQVSGKQEVRQEKIEQHSDQHKGTQQQGSAQEPKNEISNRQIDQQKSSTPEDKQEIYGQEKGVCQNQIKEIIEKPAVIANSQQQPSEQVALQEPKQDEQKLEIQTQLNQAELEKNQEIKQEVEKVIERALDVTQDQQSEFKQEQLKVQQIKASFEEQLQQLQSKPIIATEQAQQKAIIPVDGEPNLAVESTQKSDAHEELRKKSAEIKLEEEMRGEGQIKVYQPQKCEKNTIDLAEKQLEGNDDQKKSQEEIKPKQKTAKRPKTKKQALNFDDL